MSAADEGIDRKVVPVGMQVAAQLGPVLLAGRQGFADGQVVGEHVLPQHPARHQERFGVPGQHAREMGMLSLSVVAHQEVLVLQAVPAGGGGFRLQGLVDGPSGLVQICPGQHLGDDGVALFGQPGGMPVQFRGTEL